jgi:peptide/nickel transport system substrate-binding protein
MTRSLEAVLVTSVLAAGCGCIESGGRHRDAGAHAHASTDAAPPAPECPCNDRWHIHDIGAEVTGLAAEGTPEDGGELVFWMDSEPAQLQYMLQADAWTHRISIHDIVECLVRVDPKTYQVAPELAESWETSPDGLHITFHLRKGVKWHDGQPFSSADVKFTFDRLFDDTVEAGGQRSDFANVERWEAPDPDTFVLHLREPNFLTMMNLDLLVILAKHVYERGDLDEHPNNRAPVGTGPYRFVHWNAGDEILVERNRSYWGPRPHLDRIRYKIVRDRAVAFEMARRGELDFLWRLLPEQVSDGLTPELLSQYRLIQHFPNSFSFWVWNTKRPYFADAKNRQAMTLLINRPQVRCSVERCLSKMIATPVPSYHAAYASDFRPWPYNPRRAEKLLDENGWRDTDGDGVRDKTIAGRKVPFRFTFLATANSTSLQRVAAIVKQDLRRSGIDMEIQILDWSVYIGRMARQEFDAGSFLQMWPNPEVDLYGLFHSSQIGPGMQNYGAWRNERADRLMEQIRRTLDDDRRNAMQRELQRILYDEQPYTFTFVQSLSTLAKKKVRGVYTSIQWFQVRDMWIPRREQ